MEEIKQVESYYEEYDEWSRLERHRMEFEVTRRYLEKYIPQNSRVLDIGGGPGRYSIYLASQGHKVTLLDLTKKHIDIAKEKAVEKGVDLEGFIHGSALDLPDYNLGKFDVILVMGPLYHLTNPSEREKVMRDTLALLKPGGIIIASFISAYAPIVDVLKNNPEELMDAEDVLKYLENGINTAEEGFTTAYFINPQEAQDFMEEFNLHQLAFAAVEGLSALVEAKINVLPQRQFEQCVELIYKLSQDSNIIGSCEHFLYIGRKN
jgi:S-adenosylmethionine-dependent methyltransferase